MQIIDKIWERILNLEGKEFVQIRGKKFTYEVKGNSIIPSTTNRLIPRSNIEKALNFVPLENTKSIQNLQGPSYVFAILMDNRIRKSDY